MHPIEHLRYLARVEDADPADVTTEAAHALAGLNSFESAALVPAFRRLIEHQLTNGSLWTLAARMLASDEPTHEAREVISELETDRTPRHLVNELPVDSTVLIVGWPVLLAEVLRRRGDLEVLVVESGGEGSAFARRLADHEHAAQAIPDRGVAAAARVADLVLLESTIAGPQGFLAAPGSAAAAAVAHLADIPVWLAAGAGAVLPERLYGAVLERLDATGREPWDRAYDVCSAQAVDVAVGPSGPAEPGQLLGSSRIAVPGELLGGWT